MTLKTTTAQVVERSVTVNNSPVQEYDHPDDYIHTYTHETTHLSWNTADIINFLL